MTSESHLPESYRNLAPGEAAVRAAAARDKLGADLLVLGHHYQRDEVLEFADHVGDSLALSRHAAASPAARFIVFCGVHFMAESADILSAAHQQVVLPHPGAGCPMADMADGTSLSRALAELERAGGGRVVPVAYVNSSAEVKEIVGRRDGTCCTSSNARAILEWAMRKGDRVLFLPDQHLGRNTAWAMGVPLTEMALWDPTLPLGGNSPEELEAARLILWKGHCHVHQAFTVEQIQDLRRRVPRARVAVHPECPFDVVQAADDAGSTEAILHVVQSSPAGTHWGVGTEINLVRRLAARNPHLVVEPLTVHGSLCANMYRTDLLRLAWTFEELAAGRIPNQVSVPAETARWARIALERMIQIA